MAPNEADACGGRAAIRDLPPQVSHRGGMSAATSSDWDMSRVSGKRAPVC